MHTGPGSDTHFDAGIDPDLSMPARTAAALAMAEAVLMATSLPASPHCSLALVTRVYVAPFTGAFVALTPGVTTAPRTPLPTALLLAPECAVGLPALTGVPMGFGMGLAVPAKSGVTP